MTTIRIATRSSPLALWQANHVSGLIQKMDADTRIEIIKIQTSGDKILDKALYEVGGKGLFLKEIEEALLSDEADLAVHSMKDVPFELPEELTIAAILPREDPRDVLISNGSKFADLKPGAKVGTSSLRRQIQLQRLRADLNFIPLRGNVGTRLNKLDEGVYDAIILAAAGIKRLGFENRVTEYLNLIPAVGQGAVGVEIKKNRVDLTDLLKKMACMETDFCVRAERSFLKIIQGGCEIPVACHVEIIEQSYKIQAMLSSLDGTSYRHNEVFVAKEDVVATCEKLANEMK